jgi:hypothetical protein
MQDIIQVRLMSSLITQHIDDRSITIQVRRRVAARLIVAAVSVVVLIAGLSNEGRTQIKPSMKIKLSVSPSVNISRMEEGLQSSITEDLARLNAMISKRAGGVDSMTLSSNLQSPFTEDLVHLDELIAERTGGVNNADLGYGFQRSSIEGLSQQDVLIGERTGGVDSVFLGSGFSISAYENITVLLSFTPPVTADRSKNDSRAMRILCGYLNDGTTYFRRATITNKSAVQFRLRNKSLLKRSMKLNNPQFIAYVFFLVDQRQKNATVESQLPISAVTIEFL